MATKRKQKMSNKRKAAAALSALLVVALLLGGTFAWTDFGQNAINRFRGTADPDVLLHDDFEAGVNKDVYAENTGTVDTLVRIQFSEYLQIGNKAIIGESATDRETWEIHKFPAEAMIGKGKAGEFDEKHGNPPHNYFQWEMTGISKVYKPGTGEMGNFKYEEGKIFEDGTVAKYTLDSNKIITMAEYTDNKDMYDAEDNGRWILDTDGWCYWSKLLKPGQATNLLLDDVKMNETPDDNYAYFIDVNLQASNKTEAKDLIKKGTTPDGKDLIEDLAGIKEIPAEKVTINQNDLTLTEGDTETLNVTVEPAESTDKIVWTSSNENVVTVDSKGNLVAIGEGTAIITVTVGDKTDTITITVESKNKVLAFKPEWEDKDFTWTPDDEKYDGTDRIWIDNAGKINVDTNWDFDSGIEYEDYTDNPYMEMPLSDLFDGDTSDINVRLKDGNDYATSFDRGVYSETNHRGVRVWIENDTVYVGYVLTLRELRLADVIATDSNTAAKVKLPIDITFYNSTSEVDMKVNMMFIGSFGGWTVP